MDENEHFSPIFPTFDQNVGISPQNLGPVWAMGSTVDRRPQNTQIWPILGEFQWLLRSSMMEKCIFHPFSPILTRMMEFHPKIWAQFEPWAQPLTVGLRTPKFGQFWVNFGDFCDPEGWKWAFFTHLSQNVGICPKIWAKMSQFWEKIGRNWGILGLFRGFGGEEGQKWAFFTHFSHFCPKCWDFTPKFRPSLSHGLNRWP